MTLLHGDGNDSKMIYEIYILKGICFAPSIKDKFPLMSYILVISIIFSILSWFKIKIFLSKKKVTFSLFLKHNYGVTIQLAGINLVDSFHI